jgi:hypothetical protein
VKLFVDNRRDGSRMLSSAIAIAFVGLIRIDTSWGQILFVAASGLSILWWICYRKLTH